MHYIKTDFDKWVDEDQDDKPELKLMSGMANMTRKLANASWWWRGVAGSIYLGMSAAIDATMGGKAGGCRWSQWRLFDINVLGQS